MQSPLLITGFAPFPCVADNPTKALISALSGSGDAILADARRVILPTEYHVAPRRLAAAMEPRPSALLMTGFSAMAQGFTLEARATDFCLPDRPDAAGYCPSGGTGAMEAIESRLDLFTLAGELALDGIDAVISNDAGGYVCNHLYHAALSRLCAGPDAPPALFVHIPAIAGTSLAETAAGAMPLTQMIAGLGIIGRALLATPH